MKKCLDWHEIFTGGSLSDALCVAISFLHLDIAILYISVFLQYKRVITVLCLLPWINADFKQKVTIERYRIEDR